MEQTLSKKLTDEQLDEEDRLAPLSETEMNKKQFREYYKSLPEDKQFESDTAFANEQLLRFMNLFEGKRLSENKSMVAFSEMFGMQSQFVYRRLKEHPEAMPLEYYFRYINHYGDYGIETRYNTSTPMENIIRDLATALASFDVDDLLSMSAAAASCDGVTNKALSGKFSAVIKRLAIMKAEEDKKVLTQALYGGEVPKRPDPKDDAAKLPAFVCNEDNVWITEALDLPFLKN